MNGNTAVKYWDVHPKISATLEDLRCISDTDYELAKLGCGREEREDGGCFSCARG